MPFAHGAHAAAPGSAANVSMPQGGHVEAPGVPDAVPAEQFVGTVELAAHHVPAGQMSGAGEPAGHCVPAGQPVSAEAPSKQYAPAEQLVHTSADVAFTAGEKVPPGQDEQFDELAADHVPAGHVCGYAEPTGQKDPAGQLTRGNLAPVQ